MIDFTNSTFRLRKTKIIEEAHMLICSSQATREPVDSERRLWCHTRRDNELVRRKRRRKKQVVRSVVSNELLDRSEQASPLNKISSKNREERLQVISHYYCKDNNVSKHMQSRAKVPRKASLSPQSNALHLVGTKSGLTASAVRHSKTTTLTAQGKKRSTLVRTLLTLFLLVLLPCCCFTILNMPLSGSSLIMPAQAIHLDTDAKSSHLNPNILPLPSPQALSAAAAVADDGDQPSDSESYTQIPLSNDYTNKQSTYSTTTTPPAPSPQTAAHRRRQNRPPVVQVSEAELMSFADFNVQQPPFSDLMRSWPPTTVQAANRALSESGSGRRAHRLSGPGSFRSQLQANRARQFQQHQMASSNSDMLGADDGADGQMEMGSHLNEDLDDTIVTADQGFEKDQMPEPPTWINYLGDLGDYIYVQLRQQLIGKSGTDSSAQNEQQAMDTGNDRQPSKSRPLSTKTIRIEAIDELLDDHYYDQYENSQVLYYGPQLVREGEVLEIGCYLPLDQKAEWTKSGRLLDQVTTTMTGASKSISSPKVIRRSEFLSAKQNYSLKIFEASISDSGNYRCNSMSRKYHKLVVAPAHATTTQLYVIQQRLLSVVNPKLVTAPHYATRPSALPMDYSSYTTSARSRGSSYQQRMVNQTSGVRRGAMASDLLLPGYLIVENKPLIVNCNITDEFVLRRLRENPWFQVAWYKNGKQLRGSLAASAGPGLSHHHPSSGGTGPNNQLQLATIGVNGGGGRNQRNQLQQASSGGNAATLQSHLQSPLLPPTSTQRVQFLQANGRQLYISSAQYSDAGEYLCSWSKLPARQPTTNAGNPESGAGDGGGDQASGDSSFSAGDDGQRPPEATIASTPLAAGHLVQLMVPVKLRPFKSTYHVRQGNQLRLTCMAQRGYPAAHISWYAGNRLVDAEFLREHGDEYRVLHLENQNQLLSAGGNLAEASPSSSGERGSERRRIVEINPIPSSRQQMALTANGRGQWIEYRDLKDEKYAIETSEQQRRYMQMKLAQLSGASHLTAATSSDQLASAAIQTTNQHNHDTLLSQTSLSVLVINSLDLARHSSRYACRATTRANTDEVTTVIKVKESSTIVVRPSSGLATLIPGQPLHFECENVGNKKAQFKWFRNEVQIQPGDDDTIEIHNERMTLTSPRYDQIGDYICRVIDENGQVNPKESASIKVRLQPYIEEFAQETSHTGQSITVTDGERLELVCKVRDSTSHVNITWLRSSSPDDEKSIMIPIIERNNDPETTTIAPPSMFHAQPEPEIIVETLSPYSKRLLIDTVKQSHRSYYACVADNGVTEKSQRVILVRVKDRLAALWPFLGIVAQFFVLFTIIHIWDTQRAYKDIRASPKRPPGAESVPLTSG